MSLWTPDGERPVRRPTAAPDRTIEDLSPEELAQAEALAEEMAAVRAEVANTPAAVIVANHLMGFYELAAIHLQQTPPNLAEARVGIDAMAAVLDKLAGHLGEHEDVLRDARSQLQMAFVSLTRQAEAGGSD